MRHNVGIIVAWLIIPIMFGFIWVLINDLIDDGRLISSGNAIIIGAQYLLYIIIAVFIVFEIMSGIIKRQTKIYSKRTEDGIKLIKYMEGMELYIKMAESDRLKFLQSVEGVDTSNEGIVKLYEKLLPWASLFGTEKSWARELSKYYEIGDMEEVVSSDVLNGIIMSNIVHNINSSISSSINYSEPSSAGGSWSSGSSGGGGGGFSGGGGGGGGGGGW